MLKDLRTHSTHYAILGGYLAVMLAVFMSVYGNGNAEVLTILLTGFGYLVWGIVHHYMTHDLSAGIVTEYALVSTMAVVILLFALQNR